MIIKSTYEINQNEIQIIDKRCSCGAIHKVIPKGAKINSAGYWWDCQCTSTLLIIHNSSSIKSSKE